jgi:uncharacterized phage protein (TIGR02218 family)
MKSQVVPYKRRMMCMRVECANGLIVRLVEYPFDVKISGQMYYSGYDFTGIELGTTFTPSSIDLKSFIGFAGTTEASLMAGVFDNAFAYVFAADRTNPVVDYEPVTKAVFGKIDLEDNKYTVAWMTMIDALNQTVGYTFSVQCQHDFGGQEPKGCGVDAVALRVTGTIEAVNPQTEFYDSALTGVENYFVWGKMWMTSGPNVGIPPKTVKGSADEYWQIYEPFPYEVQVGDTYMLEPGCLKFLGACVAHGGIEWRLGFDYVPGETILKTTGPR